MEPEPHHPRRAPTAAMDPPSPAGARPAMSHSSAFLLPSSATPAASADAYAVVVLNQRLPRFAPLLWDRAQVRVCADGGANRVFDGMPELLPGHARDDVRSRYKPDVIKGDMDSVRPEVKEYYSNLSIDFQHGSALVETSVMALLEGGRERAGRGPFAHGRARWKGTKIVDQSHDQDTTDLHKCVAFITDNSPGPDKSNLCILVLGALGDDCLIFLLPRTHTHNIHIERSVEGPHCGLIPIGAPSTSTTTTGLRWNLDNTHMSFGGLISTSNTVDEDQVMVTSDSDLIWTISLRH
ncbi:thiamine pyrophosphokinase 3-like isoform X2 [Triticum urartu]|uniref:thiamine pyrophosphokinase 3-like isoform X2 n=1 Tax=Triticum urartu TaxID=4572 RepID=UPI00204420C0|nr:thiamine pyrophosphokinase 3-like isoform X2 [Triticum urartu]